MTPSPVTPSSDPTTAVDVLVVGGGPAGIAAATALARVRRSVLVLDAGRPRNATSPAAHNVLGHDGMAPTDLLSTGRAEATGYGVRWCDGEVVAARRAGEAFEVDLADGQSLRARRIILATGLTDELPDIPGVRAHWGRDVLHCVYCHGWEVRDQRIGVVGSSALATHAALMFRQMSDRVVLFRHTMTDAEPEALEKVRARGIEVVDEKVEEVLGRERVTGVRLGDGRIRHLDAVVVTPVMHANAHLFELLGGALTDHPFGEFVATDPMGATAVPGVWAAGNVADLMATVGASAAAGTTAGFAVNGDLVMEEAAEAVSAERVG